MPIRKIDYPPNWDEISIQVRTEADWRCEWCGAPNAKVIRRVEFPLPKKQFPGLDWVSVETITETDGTITDTVKMPWKRLRFHGLTRIVLTVAHLDRNSQNNDRKNLAALCQKCHLGHDILQHISNRRYGRHHAKAQQLKLL